MLFKSAYSNCQVLVRSEAISYHPATGVEINRVPPLTANFGIPLPEYQTEDYITGGVHEGGHILGHFFDSEAAQEELGWTDDERESVEQALIKISKEQPFLLVPVVMEFRPAEKPWPSYDDQTAKQIVEVAAATDLVDQAIAYEQENKGRTTLIVELEQIALARHRAKQDAEQAKEMAEISL